MIKLTKLPEPAILAQNKASWTAELLASAEPTKTQKNRYNHSDIKNRLRTETHGKCAYCEGNFMAHAHGDIEHIFPKSVDLSKSFEWDNLTFSCQICNQNKSDMPIDKDNFIDPYDENPNTHFFFEGAHIWSKIGMDAANVMILKLDLNRDELVRKRFNELKTIHTHLELIEKTTNPNLKKSYEFALKGYLQDPSEYAMMKRAAYFARTGKTFA